MKHCGTFLVLSALGLSACAYHGPSTRYGARLSAVPAPAMAPAPFAPDCAVQLQACGFVEQYVPMQHAVPQYHYEVETVCCEAPPVTFEPPVFEPPVPAPEPPAYVPPPPPEPPVTVEPPVVTQPPIYVPPPVPAPLVYTPPSYPAPIQPLPLPLPLRK